MCDGEVLRGNTVTIGPCLLIPSTQPTPLPPLPPTPCISNVIHLCMSNPPLQHLTSSSISFCTPLDTWICESKKVILPYHWFLGGIKPTCYTSFLFSLELSSWNKTPGYTNCHILLHSTTLALHCPSQNPTHALSLHQFSSLQGTSYNWDKCVYW
jgi:hypothetical protein